MKSTALEVVEVADDSQSLRTGGWSHHGSPETGVGSPKDKDIDGLVTAWGHGKGGAFGGCGKTAYETELVV
jgi:acyl CoA:acetate/3-ketoacid CoA transferase alpha subunit